MAVYDIEKVDISMISPDEIFILDANILFFLYCIVLEVCLFVFHHNYNILKNLYF